MIWGFTIPGEPRGKGRPRFARTPRGVRTYTDARTESFETKIAALALASRPQDWTLITANIQGFAVTVVARFQIPRSASAKKREAMQFASCAKKPDADNILKSVCDALNGIAWIDDAAVTFAAIDKRWTAEHPRIEVTIKAVT